MAKVEWAHLCDYAFYDQFQKVCMIGLFKMIHTATVPTQHPKCDFVFSLSGHPNEVVSMQFQIIRPDGKDPLINFTNHGVNLTPAGEVVNIVALNNLPLPDFGPYEVRITLNGTVDYAGVFHVNRSSPGGLQ